MREEKKFFWKLADLGNFFKNSFIAIIRSEFMVRINAGRYFVHIAYTFFLIGMIIWISLAIDTTMAKVEKNKNVLKELEIEHNQKTFEVVSLSRRSTVLQSLQNCGSQVTEPEKPAYVLTK
ncbi:MAG: hypothetical protein KBS67_00150 [Bacteroidales bacterium]|nr:hypothetical protein [Candidatus Cryptobacteroides equifaecalis]